jgi:hypothetical protein
MDKQTSAIIHEPTNALNKIQFITSIKLLHASALGGFLLQQKNISQTLLV